MIQNSTQYVLKSIKILFICMLIFSLYSGVAQAEISNAGILDLVMKKYKTAAETWGSIIQERATWLFFILATISMVWTFSQLMFHRSSFAEFFGETIRFMMFTGFFLWLLRKGPEMAAGIIDSMMEIGSSVPNQSSVSPSGLVDIGFKILGSACKESIFSFLDSPIVSLGNLIVACIVLVILALVGVNMLLQLCAAWVLAYAGIFFLGFGGSRWTSDMAINYFKTVLGVGTSLMTMVLLVGVGTSIISEYHKQMSEVLNLQELAVLLVVSITLLMLVDKLPAMVAGIITGSGIGSMGVGSFGAGSAMGAAMAVGGAGQMMGSGVSSIAGAMTGGASALKSACTSAGQAMQQGTGAFAGRDNPGGSGLNLGKAMGTTAAFATEVGKSLGQGIKNVATEKMGNMQAAEQSSIGKTFGGQVASAINNQKADAGNKEYASKNQ